MLGMILFLSMFHYINVPTLEMREKPDKNSEIASQALFSENISLLKTEGDWAEIETTIDHYKGWVEKKNIVSSETPYASTHNKFLIVNQIHGAPLYHMMDTVYGSTLTLPFESKLVVLEEKDPNCRWIKVALPNQAEAYIQRGDVLVNQPLPKLTSQEMCEFSRKFIGKPYIWGGRSSFGYDCSGFVQMLYRQMGLLLPRDSKDQMQSDLLISTTYENLKPGDLIFFGLAEDKIRHVVVFLKENQFIHATVAQNQPYIHISNLSDPDWNGSGRLSYRAFRTMKK